MQPTKRILTRPALAKVLNQAKPLKNTFVASANFSKKVTAPTKFVRSYSAPAAKAAEKHDMFCFQCEQTNNGTGCTTVGVCGKTPEVAHLQDLLINNLRNLGAYGYLARQKGAKSEELRPVVSFMCQALYSTLTNVNFDPDRFVEYLKTTEQLTNQCKEKYQQLAQGEAGLFKRLFSSPPSVQFVYPTEISSDLQAKNIPSLVSKGKPLGVETKMSQIGGDAGALQELLQYGLKGYAAYYREAELLGNTDPVLDDFMLEAMAFLSNVPGITKYDPKNPNDIVGLALKAGEHNIRVMQLLDKGGNEQFGTPQPTQVATTPVPGKCILVSGHDMGDLKAILQQTEGKGINVYTHGELLPAHGYPELKKFKHLVGNYGGAWQLQKMEFTKFPGAIVVTTNCLIEPRTQYIDRLYTTGQVGWPGVKHIKNRDFSAVVKKAQETEGFGPDVEAQPKKYVTTGFGHKAVLGIADIIINAVKKGDIKRFYLIGGCDGTEGERNYFKELATGLPQDNVILTLGCAKYRFNKLDHGTITTTNPRDNSQIQLPRLLDMGQCNDAYSAVVVASALAEAFGTKDLNKLPLSYGISWFEQKAVVIFLTLMHLGLRNIRIGPHLPAFVPASTLNFLVNTFNLQPIDHKNVKSDIEKMGKGL